MSVSAYQMFLQAHPIEFDSLIFPGGEPHVRLHNPDSVRETHVVVDCRARTVQDFMLAMVLTDAIRRNSPRKLELLIPYFPGARQDRAEGGSALTAKVYADIINQQIYDTVYILDPHSDVTPALIENVRVVRTTPYIKEYLSRAGLDPDGLICPDAGAEKRTLKVAKALGGKPIIYARKVRDTKTGAITGFEFVTDLTGMPHGDWLVVDDICDGGKTFEALADAFSYTRLHGKDSRLHLWVTHGIFSKGLDDLLALYSTVGTTDSFYAVGADRLHVVPVFHEVFKGENKESDSLSRFWRRAV